jgi:hypothetical protein
MDKLINGFGKKNIYDPKNYKSKLKTRKYVGILEHLFIVDFGIKTYIKLILVINIINSFYYQS